MKKPPENMLNCTDIKPRIINDMTQATLLQKYCICITCCLGSILFLRRFKAFLQLNLTGKEFLILMHLAT